ncbi:MAG TPA: DUF4340 domain-containing protein [Verrucomicrobiae bacterium]|nr:DUF4340 domain-containing protein [Verrucomicrobiae bacterium]
MNKKQFAILVFVLLVLGGAGLMLYKRQNNSWESAAPGTGKKILGELPVNDITRIVIRHGTNELNLFKTNDMWLVQERGNYPANFSQISSFLIKAQNLKAVQVEPIGPSQLGRLDLATRQGTNLATEVVFDGTGGKVINTLLLGKKHMRKSTQPSPYGGMGNEGWPDGRYVMVGDNKDTVMLISDPLTEIEPNASQWLDKDFFKVAHASTVAVDYPAATNSWKLTRQTEFGQWKLADPDPGELLDSNKVSSISNPLSNPSFADVAVGLTPKETGLDHPTVIKLDTFDQFHYTVNVGAKTNDQYYLTVATTADIPQKRPVGKDEKPAEKAKLDKAFNAHKEQMETKLKQEQALGRWTYLVSSWTVQPLLKKRSELLEKPKPEKKTEISSAKAAIGSGKGSGTNSVPTAVPSPPVSSSQK